MKKRIQRTVSLSEFEDQQLQELLIKKGVSVIDVFRAGMAVVASRRK